MAELFLLKPRFRAVCCFTGSVSFALRGLAIASHDIDIQTDAHGAYAIEHCFPSYVTQPVAFSATEKIRSHFCYT